MQVGPPRSVADLPGVIPVFPLAGVLLLPHGRLPLNIFEPRYLAMTLDALATPMRLIGMIQPTEAEAPERPPKRNQRKHRDQGQTKADRGQDHRQVCRHRDGPEADGRQPAGRGDRDDCDHDRPHRACQHGGHARILHHRDDKMGNTG